MQSRREEEEFFTTAISSVRKFQFSVEKETKFSAQLAFVLNSSKRRHLVTGSFLRLNVNNFRGPREN
jgi:hypothetical protein